MSKDEDQHRDVEEADTHPGPRNMGLKFLVLQLFMVIFGVALFFGLAAFKKSIGNDTVTVMEESEETIEPVVPDRAERMKMPPEFACDFGDWIGQPVDEEAVKATGRPYRVLPPGAMATMDYLPERINLHTDENGIVVDVRCG